jgi:hypothetical protein
MTRQTLFLKVGSTLLVVYLLLCLDLLPTPFISSSIMSQILPTVRPPPCPPHRPAFHTGPR